MMQSDELASLLVAEPDAKFVVPDIAFVEMSKHPNWEYTMGLALPPLASASGRIFMSLSVGEAMGTELEMLQPITTDQLLPEDYCKLLRGLVLEFHEERVGEARTKIAERFDKTRTELLEEEPNPDLAKAQTKGLVDIWREALKPEVLKELRRSGAGPDLFLAMAQVNAEIFFTRLLQQQGVAASAIDVFKKSKPCVLRYLYLITRHSLLSTLKGMGWEALAASKELNNRLDQEYALTASFFDGLLSLDKAANAAHADLMHMLGTSMDDAVSTLRSILDPSTPPPAAAPAA